MTAARLTQLALLGAAAAMLALFLRAGVLLVELIRYRAEAAVLAEVAAVCFVFVVAAASLLACLRLRASRRASLALAVASAWTVLYAAEIRETLNDPARRRLGEKAALIERLGRQGTPAYGGVEPLHFVWAREADEPAALTVGGRAALPLAGISRRLQVDCQEGPEAGWLVFEADEHGFHNPTGLWASAPVELAAVGDSFTAGSCVPSPENMVARLRERFATALNLGVPGNGPLLMLAEIREYLPLARPRVVLWCHFAGNDLLDLRRERSHPILARYLEAGFRQGLSERQAALDASLEARSRDWLERSTRSAARFGPRLRTILSLRATRSRLGLAFPDLDAFTASQAELGLFDRVLREAQVTVAAWGGRLVFVYLPAWREPPRQVGERALATLGAESRQRVLAIARGLGLRVVDVEQAFARHPAPTSLYACPGCHYSPAGYRLAAEAVLADFMASPP